MLFSRLLTRQVFSSRAPVSLESIVSNLSSHITIPVATTTVQKHGTLKNLPMMVKVMSAKLDQQTQSRMKILFNIVSVLQARDLPSRTFQDC